MTVVPKAGDPLVVTGPSPRGACLSRVRGVCAFPRVPDIHARSPSRAPQQLAAASPLREPPHSPPAQLLRLCPPWPDLAGLVGRLVSAWSLRLRRLVPSPRRLGPEGWKQTEQRTRTGKSPRPRYCTQTCGGKGGVVRDACRLVPAPMGASVCRDGVTRHRTALCTVSSQPGGGAWRLPRVCHVPAPRGSTDVVPITSARWERSTPFVLCCLPRSPLHRLPWAHLADALRRPPRAPSSRCTETPAGAGAWLGLQRRLLRETPGSRQDMSAEMPGPAGVSRPWLR